MKKLFTWLALQWNIWNVRFNVQHYWHDHWKHKGKARELRYWLKVLKMLYDVRDRYEDKGLI